MDISKDGYCPHSAVKIHVCDTPDCCNTCENKELSCKLAPSAYIHLIHDVIKNKKDGDHGKEPR
ncbi:unnamed protein product [Acanthoscelides obtectus]|uniref:Uncharacterized protein n=1 Tax=Acanthoscelides obtectus TaxID=200917 RepID=A0A9P0PUR6_ACAOB|nr:unnamed protein product [Acanthoscelides obtectus]CAK1648260.1 hypothetical protein AOBTE_LOCUS15621 [Acanthoscelides obtectus]